MVSTVFSLVMTMMIYMIIGYVLCKVKLGVPDHAKTLSAILIYILGPCMIINAFLSTEYSLDTLQHIGMYFVATLILQSLFFAILYLIFHRKYTNAKYRIMTAASVLGNVGFLGLPLVSGIFPNEPIVMCYSSVNVMSMNLLVFTVGTYLITNDKKYISPKGALFNPTTIAIIIALPLFILRISLPGILTNACSSLAKMVTPVCMLILGMRLSTVPFKVLVSQKFVYLACFMKLLVFPIFAFLCVNFIPFLPESFRVCCYVLAAVPSGAIIESLAELHNCEQEASANVVLLTSIFCVVTLPFIISILYGVH